MPPPGGTRVSLSYNWNSPAANAAFQPSNGVFSPGLPLQPMDGQQPTRAFDFNVGINTVITPRSGWGDIHSFASLRAYANVEPVRLAIETCKDQVERLDWKIKAVDGKRGQGADDARIKALTKFFRKPDGTTHFATWLREAMEDLLVIDAPSFEKRRDRGGKLIGLDVVPGDTFKLLVDETGRRPKAPLPAYQQIIKGVVWNNLTTDDLIYAPRNPRPNHLYGFSPVEQIIVTINTVMRRQGVQLAYFTDNNTPAGIINVPAGWSADAIKSMQDVWDARMEGEQNYKNKVQWVPDGAKYQAFKDSPIKDEFDEWLYRIVCFTFSLPPTAFIKQMNRATAAQGSDTGKEEGIESRKTWWKRLADDIIQEEFGYTDLEWGWSEDVEVDALKQAQVDDLNLKNGSTFINEVRDSRGLDVVEGGEVPLIYLATGVVPLAKAIEDALNPPEPPPVMMMHPGMAQGGEPPEATQGAKKPANGEEGAQGGKAPHPPKVSPPNDANKLAKAAIADMDRPLVRRAIAKVTRKTAAVLKAVGDDVAGQVEDKLAQFGKAADDSTIGPTLAQHIADQVVLDALNGLDISDDLADVGSDAGQLAVSKLGVESNDQLVNQIDQTAVDYARRRAAELVSVQGPDNIVQSTRNMIRDVIAKGLEDNIGSRSIADNIQAATAFSPERAAVIAAHEIKTANTQGTLSAGRAVAAQTDLVLTKAWLISNLGCCDICQDNADAGYIPIDDEFPSGDDGTPGHPNCRCDTALHAEDPADPDSSDEE